MRFDLIRSTLVGNAPHAQIDPNKVRVSELVDFFRAVFVLNHVDRIPQPTENTRKIFAVLQSIFVDDTPPLFEKKRTLV